MAKTKVKVKTLHLTNPHIKGEHVVEAQKLLKAHGYYKGAFDGEFGAATGNACKRAKFDLGYLNKDIKATYGYPLSSLLAGTMKLPTAYRIRQTTRRKKAKRHINHEMIERGKIVANARWLIAHKNECDYYQLRPIDGEHHYHKLPLRIDCSGGDTLCYSWSDAPDPNGEGYNGEGYTGTFLNNLLHIHPVEVIHADIGVYGTYPGRHAVLALSDGPDPIVFSMGHEGDPNPYRASSLLSIGPLQWLTPRRW